jgi:hypothetical protein
MLNLYCNDLALNTTSQLPKDMHIAPAHGIRGHGRARKAMYVQQDNNLRLLYQQHQNAVASAGNHDILNYLRNVSHQLADYQM